MDTISVVIPYHKGLHFLKNSLDSMNNQQMQNIEVVLVGHNVEDEISDLINNYNESGLNIKYKELKNDLGVASARNEGIQLATGEYIYFLDSDDYIIDDTLKLLFDKAEKENLDVVLGNTQKTWYKRESFIQEFDKAEFLEQCKAVENNVEKYFLSGISVCGTMIRTEFLKNNQIEMDEGFIYYSDFTFMTKVFAAHPKASVVKEALYLKRSHNDPINFPALCQMEDDTKKEQYIKSYRKCKSIADGIGWLNITLDTLLCKYVLNMFIKSNTSFYSMEKKAQDEYISSLKSIDLSKVELISNTEKKVLKKVAANKVKSAVRFGKLIFVKRKKKGKFGNKIQWYRLIDKFIFRKMAVKENWVLFESFLGKNYADSCKYIYEYLLENHNDEYKFIWVFDDKHKKIKGNPKIIKRNGLKYLYYTSRSKYWVNNMRQPIWFEKRPEMVYLETWHGTPLKKLVFDMEDVHSASPLYKKNFYKQSRMWDYLLSDNHFSTDVFKRAFMMESDKILELGYPRNDILYKENKEEIADKIKESLGIPKGKKTILYAPTWRDDDYYGPGKYKFSLALDLDRLQKEFGDEYIVLLRTHYFIADQLDITGKEDFVRNVCKYDDVGELYLISDICITDYSSVFFDFANLKRPILFYTYDFDKYKDVLRGFYIDMETELPGPLLFNNDEIVDAIKNIDRVKEQYKEKYEKFHDTYCNLDDGHAAEKIVKKVFDKR